MQRITDQPLIAALYEIRNSIVMGGEVRHPVDDSFHGYRRECVLGEIYLTKFTMQCRVPPSEHQGPLVSAITGPTWRIVMILGLGDPPVRGHTVFLNGNMDDLVADVIEYRLRFGRGPI